MEMANAGGKVGDGRVELIGDLAFSSAKAEHNCRLILLCKEHRDKTLDIRLRRSSACTLLIISRALQRRVKVGAIK